MKPNLDDIKLDWLTLVFPIDEHLGYLGNQILAEMVERVLEIAHLSKLKRQFEKKQAFGLRYSHVLECQHGITVLANLFEPCNGSMELVDWCKMGFAMVFSGRALAQYRAFLASHGLDFYEIKHNLEVYTKVKATRIDIAKDIREKRGHLRATPSQMYKLVKDGYVRGQRRGFKYKWIESGQVFNEVGVVTTGETLYLGARQSEFQLRIYDKAKERYYSHGDTWRDPKGFHIRWEIELKGCLAISVWESLTSRQGLIEAYHRLLAQKVRVYANLYKSKSQAKKVKKERLGREIKVIDEDGVITSYKAQSWYADFIGRKTYRAFTVDRPVSTVTSKQRWFEKNITGLMHETLRAHIIKGGDPYQLIAHWLKQGKLRGMNNFNFDPSFFQKQLSDYTPHSSEDLPYVGVEKELGLAEIVEEFIRLYDQ